MIQSYTVTPAVRKAEPVDAECGLGQEMSVQKPNIVFVHVDQMHHKALSAYGNEYVHTPNLDKIVREGYSFMESYTAMPQCCPARASWFTGRMSKEHGVVVNSYPIDPDIPDLGQWLRKVGYETVHTGKWHVSGRKVTDSFQVLHRGSGHGELGDSTVARSAVAYLKNRTGRKPFFLSVGFLNPHDCCFPASRDGGPGKYAFAAKIKDKLPPLPANFDKDYRNTGMQQIQNWSHQDWRYYIYSYYRMVEMVDAEVGRVYDAVRNSRPTTATASVFMPRSARVIWRKRPAGCLRSFVGLAESKRACGTASTWSAEWILPPLLLITLVRHRCRS